MAFFIRDVGGITLPVQGMGVANIKKQIADAHGVPACEQRLICDGMTLDDCDDLNSCSIAEGSTVFVSSDLDGGAKKRKKKTYTKPKKIKHKRKKVKLAVLKFYKVDSNDKVTRLRRECPHEICGPGVFMAMHFNRYYCGKCHLTYLIKKGDADA